MIKSMEEDFEDNLKLARTVSLFAVVLHFGEYLNAFRWGIFLILWFYLQLQCHRVSFIEIFFSGRRMFSRIDVGHIHRLFCKISFT